MTGSDNHPDKYNVLVQLFDLIKRANQQKKATILRHLVKDNLDTFLFKRIIELPPKEQNALYEQLKTELFNTSDIEEEVSQPIELDERESRRKPCLLSVDFSTQDFSYSDIIRDISIGGVFIETAIAISVGRELTLKFAFPSSSEIFSVRGKIVRKGSNGIGIKFVKLTPRQKELINSFTGK